MFPLGDFLSDGTEEVLQNRRNFAQGHYRNRASCSCNMCCSPRQSCYYKGRGRLTMQEVRAEEAWRSQREDISI
jgi:hypothetical protein